MANLRLSILVPMLLSGIVSPARSSYNTPTAAQSVRIMRIEQAIIAGKFPEAVSLSKALLAEARDDTTWAAFEFEWVGAQIADLEQVMRRTSQSRVALRMATRLFVWTRDQGMGDETIASVRDSLLECVSLYVRALGEETVLGYPALWELAEAQLSSRQYDRAFSTAQRAKNSARIRFGPRHPLFAYGEALAARAYYAQNLINPKGQEAVEWVEDAVSVYREHSLDHHLWTARGLTILGAMQTRFDRKRAEPMLREATGLFESLNQTKDPGYSISLIQLALLHMLSSDYEEAEAELIRAYRVYRSSLHGNRIRRKQAETISHTFQRMMDIKGRGAEAKRIIEEMDKTYGNLTAGGGDESTGALLSQAATSANRGDLARATEQLARALATETNPLLVSIAYAQLAMIRVTEGHFSEAEHLAHLSLETAPSIPSGDYQRLGALTTLAEIYIRERRMGDAEEQIRRALAFANRIETRYARFMRALSSELTGRIKNEQGEYEGAEIDVRFAVTRLENIGNKTELPAVLNLLASICIAQGRSDEARSILDQSVHLSRKYIGVSSPEGVDALRLLASIAYEESQWEHAVNLLNRSVRAFETGRTRTSLSFGGNWEVPSPYPVLALTHLKLAHPDSAWAATEAFLARWLTDAFAAGTISGLTRGDSAMSVVLSGNLGRAERNYAALNGMHNPADSVGSYRFEQVRKAYFDARAKWEAFQGDIRARYANVDGHYAPLDRVQSVLDDSTAILGWLDVTLLTRVREAWVYVVRNRGQVRWTRLPTANDSTMISEFMLQLRNNQPGRKAAHLVWLNRIKPALKYLDGCSRLVVVPSGPMGGLPIEAIPDDSGELLADRFPITYAPSATIYARLSHRNTSDRNSGRPALLVGDPVFNEELRTITSGNHTVRRGALDGRVEDIASLPSLPRTRDEIRGIAALAPTSTVLLGSDASEQRVSSLVENNELAQFGVLHFATHALIDFERPGRTALILSQVGLTDPVESLIHGAPVVRGLIRAGDIARHWHLDADLVTLSACETGLGKRVTGEGLVGFTQAFFKSGAKRVLVSLWPVDDTAAAMLMLRFYENYYGKRGSALASPGNALDEARRFIRGYHSSRGDTPFNHPYYWSGFVLVGVP